MLGCINNSVANKLMEMTIQLYQTFVRLYVEYWV